MMLLWFRWCKLELFRQYKNAIVTFEHNNFFKNNYTTALRDARNIYFQRKFTQCSNNSRNTWKTLNNLIRCKNTSKDVILNHNGSTVRDPSDIPEVFNNYFWNVASNLDCNIPHSNISPLNFLGAPAEKSIFCPTSEREKRTNPLTSWIFLYLYITF